MTTGLYSPSCAPVFCNDLALGDAVIYEVVKFLHIFIAIIWIGGAFGAIFVGTLAHRRSDTAAVLSTVRNISILAKYIFMPASVVLPLALRHAWRASVDAAEAALRVQPPRARHRQFAQRPAVHVEYDDIGFAHRRFQAQIRLNAPYPKTRFQVPRNGPTPPLLRR